MHGLVRIFRSRFSVPFPDCEMLHFACEQSHVAALAVSAASNPLQPSLDALSLLATVNRTPGTYASAFAALLSAHAPMQPSPALMRFVSGVCSSCRLPAPRADCPTVQFTLQSCGLLKMKLPPGDVLYASGISDSGTFSMQTVAECGTSRA